MPKPSLPRASLPWCVMLQSVCLLPVALRSGMCPLQGAGLGVVAPMLCCAPCDTRRPAGAARPPAQEEEERAALIARRAGAVLGPHTLLKQDHFSGCQSLRVPALFPGAPNFRAVPGVRVFGGAIATVQVGCVTCSRSSGVGDGWPMGVRASPRQVPLLAVGSRVGWACGR